ncbi:MAG: argininosuccinate lyase [Oscillospiraceae bacterium]|jgi:argininosuccinate lyase|nr:argininosuccinate lyase [Oscillospiraceae bacterium]
MSKLWSGRFSETTHELTDELNASIDFDKRLYFFDIVGSQAHAEMLARQGIIPVDDAKKIVEGLDAICADIEQGKFEFSRADEDIHMAIEAELTARIGEAGKRLHTARSRNDQVAVDFRMYIRQEGSEVIALILDFILTLTNVAETHIGSVMPAYTHLQRAQPATLAHYLLAYCSMLTRDVTRLENCLDRLNESPLGAGALAGTTHDIDRFMTASLLGFRGPMINSLDAVSDRDFALELLSDLSILAMHLSRYAEEIVIWNSHEFRFVEMADAFSTGSSIMPQKKNPDLAELARGKTGRVYGDLIALLTVMKGLPLAYNKDMQEDKEPVFDALDTVKLVLKVINEMTATMKINAARMKKAAQEGFITATDMADYLVRRGLAFRESYTVVGQLVKYCIDSEKTFETLTLEEYKSFSEAFEDDIFAAIDLENCIAGRKSFGSPAPEFVREQLQTMRVFLREHAVTLGEEE